MLQEKAPRYLGPEFPAKANTPQYRQLLYYALEVLFVGFFYECSVATSRCGNVCLRII